MNKMRQAEILHFGPQWKGTVIGTPRVGGNIHFLKRL